MRFLIVEKDEFLNKIIEQVLNNHEYTPTIDVVLSMSDAFYYSEIRNYDLILLDWDNGNKEVIEFIEKIKQERIGTKIIVISDETSIESEIKALKSGADDFLRKPINFELLIAKIEAKIRFVKLKKIQFGDLEIFPNNEKITFKGENLNIKGKPFQVFLYLATNNKQIISKEQLLDALWEEPELVTPNVIEVAINQIRQKIDKTLGINTIETIRRRGYKFIYPSKNSLSIEKKSEK